MQKKESKYILLGGCRRPHGLKGQFELFLENYEDSVIKSGIEVLLTPQNKDSSLPPDGKIFTVKTFSQANKCLLGLEEVVGRNQAEEILPFDLHVKRSLFPETNDEEVYLVDIIGLKAINDKSGEELGVVEKYYDHGAQIVLVIKGHKTLDIPFIDQFVTEIDYDNKTIKVIPMELI